MDCKHRIVLQYIPAQLFVYVNKSMTKYCIVKNAQAILFVKMWVFQNIKTRCMARPFKFGRLHHICLKFYLSNHFKEDVSQRKKPNLFRNFFFYPEYISFWFHIRCIDYLNILLVFFITEYFIHTFIGPPKKNSL